MSQAPKLHLGITMAGAVSGGAYTAGVIDYLFEALQTWETARKNEDHLLPDKKTIPPHEVQIEVIGGASAGAITAALAALSCYAGLAPVGEKKPAELADENSQPNNLLFDAWVNLAGGKGVPEAMRRMLSVKDLIGAEGIPALLNSGPVDTVAAQAVEKVVDVTNRTWPGFVAKDLEVLLTLCSLRGIPVGIDFNSGNGSWSAQPTHQMSIHKLYARFRTERTASDSARAMAVHPADKDSLEMLMDIAKASSAFPIGLQARQVSLSRNHVRYQVGKFYELHEKALDSIFQDKVISDPFEFTSVDGGALNNEPFTEIAQIMKERGHEDSNFAMILVDPFPNFGKKEPKYVGQKYLRELIVSIIGALRNQGMLKEKDLHEMGGQQAEVRASFKKNMIFPTRKVFKSEKNVWLKQDNPMACGALGGFSGLFSREFRLHDFYLGRQNCRNFLHSYFTMEYDTTPGATNNHEIFKDWTQAMREKYRVAWRDQGNIQHLPIIPTIDFIHSWEQKVANMEDRSSLVLDAEGKKFALTMPINYPKIRRGRLNALWFPIALRFFMMAHILIGRIFFPLNWLIRLVNLVTAPFLFGYMAYKTIVTIRKDLKDNGLVK